MIRFIDLGDQITCDGCHQFAFFDTIRDKFIEFDDYCTWSSWEEFEECYDYDDTSFPNNLERFRRLFGWDK